jgi:hypothetical protein
MTGETGGGLMTEINRAPALRISHVVQGRTNENGRVRYLVDPTGQGEERAIPEDVVLKRWRRREMSGYSFHGCWLGPNLWRAVDRSLGRSADLLRRPTTDEIDAARRGLRLDDETRHLWVPEARAVWALFNGLGPSRLQKVLDRHLAPEREGRFGTPDLFLYARGAGLPGTAFYRLVEVKRPRERVSPDQHEEIAFLRSIGVPARVLRLIERG